MEDLGGVDLSSRSTAFSTDRFDGGGPIQIVVVETTGKTVVVLLCISERSYGSIMLMTSSPNGNSRYFNLIFLWLYPML